MKAPLNPAQIMLRELYRKAPKHGGSRVEEDGYVFASEPERRRYRELRNLERAGEIRGLIVHPEYELVPPVVVRGVLVPRLGYTADFEYEERQGDGSWLAATEEVKAKARYAWHGTASGRVTKRKAYDGARGADYVMRVNLFRRAYPGRVFREIRME
ncbi:MAG: DUF1064 domain-containing protein [Coriobacteriales bacterium]